MNCVKLTQISQLRSENFDAEDGLNLGPPANAKDRVAGTKTDDGDVARGRMYHQWQGAEHTVDVAVRDPTLSKSIHKHSDVGLGAGSIISHQGDARTVLGENDPIRSRTVQLRPENLRGRQKYKEQDGEAKSRRDRDAARVKYLSQHEREKN